MKSVTCLDEWFRQHCNDREEVKGDSGYGEWREKSIKGRELNDL